MGDLRQRFKPVNVLYTFRLAYRWFRTYNICLADAVCDWARCNV